MYEKGKKFWLVEGGVWLLILAFYITSHCLAGRTMSGKAEVLMVLIGCFVSYKLTPYLHSLVGTPKREGSPWDSNYYD